MSGRTQRTQPVWKQRSGSRTQLYIYNSLTRSKCEFVAENGQTINWYNCGPTVYDSAHMGHARSYITFDIIRRVLQNYFNYDVYFVQNVTDIDDKIIRRARQNYLYDQYCNDINAEKQHEHKISRFLSDINESLANMRQRHDNEEDLDKKNMLNTLITNAQQLISSKPFDVSYVLTQTKDVLSDWLDREKGHEVTDNEIFISLPRQYEKEYNEDMRLLNILPPDEITRVSEFIPEIIEYIKVIIENDFAYVSNGSVYFNTDKFDSDKKHFYAKLVPEAFGDSKALAEGEGDLSVGAEKRNANDFALWKSSKSGEPFWRSPWGNGRPGWHIECSVMASSRIGKQLDIHSGGIDLKFPHHDNEMAQSEAYYNLDIKDYNWVNYFLHSGHLTISGCKMSKSLKNFITIKDALKKNTARQLRLAFLLHSWKDTLDYSDNTMYDAINYEKTVNEFILTVDDLLRQNQDYWFEKSGPPEIELNKRFYETKDAVRKALCDNIDTKTACEKIKRLISDSNRYLKEKIHNILLLKNITTYIRTIFNIFGAEFESSHVLDNVSREENFMSSLQVMVNFREKIRIEAKKSKNNELLIICDELRDNVLPYLGVRLEDYDAGDGITKSRLKLVDSQILIKEMEDKLEIENEKRVEKERKRLEKQLLDQEKEALKKIPPFEMFKSETDKYSAFDEIGIPTHDFEGKELSKSQIKKLQKMHREQEKRYNDYIKTSTNNVVIDQI